MAPALSPMGLVQEATTQAMSDRASSVDWQGVLKMLESSADFIEVATAAANGDKNLAIVAFSNLVQDPTWQQVVDIFQPMGFQSIAVLAGQEAAFIVGLKGMTGVMTGTQDTSTLYWLEEIGLSAGTSEGGPWSLGCTYTQTHPKTTGVSSTSRRPR